MDFVGSERTEVRASSLLLALNCFDCDVTGGGLEVVLPDRAETGRMIVGSSDDESTALLLSPSLSSSVNSDTSDLFCVATAD